MNTHVANLRRRLNRSAENPFRLAIRAHHRRELPAPAFKRGVYEWPDQFPNSPLQLRAQFLLCVLFKNCFLGSIVGGGTSELNVATVSRLETFNKMLRRNGHPRRPPPALSQAYSSTGFISSYARRCRPIPNLSWAPTAPRFTKPGSLTVIRNGRTERIFSVRARYHRKLSMLVFRADRTERIFCTPRSLSSLIYDGNEIEIKKIRPV